MDRPDANRIALTQLTEKKKQLILKKNGDWLGQNTGLLIMALTVQLWFVGVTDINQL